MLTRIPDFNLKKFHTFGMDVSCREWIEYETIDDLISALNSLDGVPWMHIGSGSNLLFTGDYPGAVLHSANRKLEVAMLSDGVVEVEAGAGMEMDRLIDWAASSGLWGIENLSDIPGEVGAAAVQNVGAYGVEIKDVVKTVKCYDTVEHRFVNYDVSECQYGYRDSLFKHPEVKGRYIVLSVVFHLSSRPHPQLDYGNLRGQIAASGIENPTPADVREAVIAIRRSKLPLPDETGSAGSFFKNPVVPAEVYHRIADAGDGNVPHYVVDGGVKIPAAWLIDQCGWKGRSMGNAAVWHKQPLIIVNSTGHASPDEIIALERAVIRSVKERFGIELSPEVEHI